MGNVVKTKNTIQSLSILAEKIFKYLLITRIVVKKF